MASTSKLFEAVQVGNITLQHRVVLPPLTRFRADKNHVPYADLVKEYYVQRSHAKGTLLITEGVFIHPKAGGYDHVSGIWSKEQIQAWKKVVDGVHEAGSFVFMQIWALGRAAQPSVLKAEDANYDHVGPSAIPMPDRPAPRPLTKDEIHEYAQWYAQAAHNAVIEAGFDGVELHGANGYIIDQFLQDVSNQRDDEYGGSVENRSRFALEMVDAVVKAVGPERTAIRLSPAGSVQGMGGMDDSRAQFSHVVSSLKVQHPKLAFLDLVEPRFVGVFEESSSTEVTNDYIRDIWAPKRLVSSGGFTLESAIERADRTGDLVAFGRLFISNPDIIYKLKNKIPLTPYNRKTFYLPGDTTNNGYTDYPFAEEQIAESRL